MSNTPRVDACVRSEEIPADGRGFHALASIYTDLLHLARTLERALARYEHAFSNLETLVGNNIDEDNVEARVMVEIDRAREDVQRMGVK